MKKAESNTMWMIVVAVLALIVLTVSVIMLYGGLKGPADGTKKLTDTITGGANDCISNPSGCNNDNIFKSESTGTPAPSSTK